MKGFIFAVKIRLTHFWNKYIKGIQLTEYGEELRKYLAAILDEKDARTALPNQSAYQQTMFEQDIKEIQTKMNVNREKAIALLYLSLEAM